MGTMLTNSGLALEVTPEERLGAVESELLARGAASAAYGRWSLYQHLANTANLLEQWRQGTRLELAGSLLGIYRPEIASRLSKPFTRERVRELIGDDAERMVYLSSVDSRSHVSADSALLPTVPSIIQALGTALTRDLAEDEARDLFVALCASCANTSEDDGTPALWLAAVSQAAQAAVTSGLELPEALERVAKAAVSPRAERSLREAYLALSKNIATHPRKLAAVERGIQGADVVGEPFVLLGLCALADGDIASAAKFGTQARARLASWCTQWDKRISVLQWLGLAQFLERTYFCNGAESHLLVAQLRRVLQSSGGRIECVYVQLDSLELLGRPTIDPPCSDTADHDVVEDLEGYSDFDILPPRFSQYIAGLRENGSRPLMGIYPALTARPWWDPLEFDVCKKLRRRANDIIKEFRAVGELFRRVVDELGDERMVFPLLFEGKRDPTACARFPVTASLLQESETSCALGNDIYFARLPAGSERHAHRAYTNVWLRCCLVLTTGDDAGLTVDGLPEQLREGRILVFDPSFLHEEWNHGTSDHCYLVVDLWHPDITSDERELLEGLNRLVVASAGRLQRRRLPNASLLWGGDERAVLRDIAAPQD
jgi:hypothetical protein